jgi:CubicO group peptidase (beta-lactamase class C family)
MRPRACHPAAVFPLLVAALTLGVAPSAAQTPADDSIISFSEAADRVFSHAFKAMEIVPGMAVAVIRGDRIVYIRGFGQADREAGIEATGTTDFYIASATKSFTALAVALLDARGELDLDASLASYFPEVEFDPELKPDSITLRDLLTHTSGLENFGIPFRLAFSGEHTPEILVDVLAFSEPSARAPLGTFQYTNTGYNIAGMIIDRVTGVSWQDQLRELVFEPAGMERTTAYASRPRRQGWPVAAPYTGLGAAGVERLYLEKRDNTMQSAGGMYTTAADLSRWVIAQLNEGRIGDRPVFPAEVIRETQRMQAETSSTYGPFGRDGYGLGWYGGMLGDERLLHHFGGFAGFHAHVSFMPQRGLGVVVLANEAGIGSRLVELVATFAYDWWLGKPDVEKDYAMRVEEMVAARDEARTRVEQGRASRTERTWQLTEPLEAYAGTYVSPELGTVIVWVEEKNLHVRMGNMHSSSTPFTEPNSIRLELVPGGGQVLRFELDEEGKVAAARLVDARFEKVD